MSEPTIDVVPSTALGAAPQATADIHIVGNEAVEMLNALAGHLAGVADPKGAVLRMIGIFHAAIGRDLLVQERGGEARMVQDLWR